MRNGLGRALTRSAVVCSLVGAWFAFMGPCLADETCSSLAPCVKEGAAAPAGPELAGGARTPVPVSHWPLQLGEGEWSPLRDRHDLIIGASDAAHDDTYE